MISVIIPAFNAADTLGLQLQALSDQRDAPPFQIIVADNGSTDATREVAESFAASMDVRVVDASAARGPAFARNVGASAATTPYLLFCDADDRVRRNWVAVMRRALETESMVTGPVLRCGPGPLLAEPTDPPPAPEWLGRRFLNRIPYAATSNLGIHAALFVELGGFDSAMRACEDAEFCVRAHLRGIRIGWARDAVVYRSERETFWQVATQSFWWGASDVAVYEKHRSHDALRRTGWEMARPYLALSLRAYMLLTPRRRWWIAQAAQRAGRLKGSVRRRVFCP